MTHIRKWAGVGLVALLLALVLSRLTGLQTDIAEAAAPKSIMVGAASLAPENETTVFTNAGDFIQGSGAFHAPVQFPVNKKAISAILYFYDNYDDEVCADLWVKRPATGAVFNISPGSLCSVDGTTNPNSVSLDFADYKVLAGDVLYVYATFQTNSANLKIYGLSIQYR